MSDYFQMLVDADVSLEDAGFVADAVIGELRSHGLIKGQLTYDDLGPDSGPEGYRPGPATPNLYKQGREKYQFWKVRPRVVEVRIERSFNLWFALVCEGYACPLCGAQFDDGDKLVEPPIVEALGEWMEQSGPALVNCPWCGGTAEITRWHSDPPFGFGNLAFVFWNWPELDCPPWKIDIPDIVRKVTGHTIVSTFGHT
jgi:hypothetical protein